MLVLAIALIIVAAILRDLFKFATADGDFTLISKGKARREEIEDKVFWITGASRGIGEVLAKQLASLGAKLILSARSEKELERPFAFAFLMLASFDIGKHAPDGVEILPLDLASGEESLKEAVDKAESFFSGSGVDYMVHNAAYERPKASALESTEGNLKATFDVNVLGTISNQASGAFNVEERERSFCCVASFLQMSSAAGKTPAPGQAIYSASKYAINGYFHSLRSELYRKGIKVTVVCPGPIDTSNSSTASTPEMKRRISSERCAELTLVAATHGLKEAWISDQNSQVELPKPPRTEHLSMATPTKAECFFPFLYWYYGERVQPVLAIMYLVQYMPTVGYWIMDKVGGNRVEAATQKGNTYSWKLLFGHKKTA
ncbi:hypothetical protein Sjap_006023 [Stephania japonica]|uniref:Dehydrogenase/reductase SDR family member 7 n=1 Tax=Stephania japonica TaxID=461633 RepID=A0AAP0K694_9MAGN